MSSGKSKEKKAKFTPVQSVFQGIDSYNVDLGGMTSASAQRTPGQSFNMTSTLSPGLSQARDTATTGLNNNLTTIAMNPTQQLQDLQAGNNSFYNLQAELNRRASETALGQAQKRFSSTGLENSTVRGAFEGQLQNDQLLQDLATRQASLEFLNAQALNNITGQNQTLGNLANIQSIPLQMAQQNALTGLGAVDQTSQFNSGQQNQVSMFNAQQANQMAMQAAQNRASLMGNLLGAGMSLAALPLTGGLSGLGSLSALGGLGSTAGSMMGRAPTASPFVGNFIRSGAYR